MIRVLDALREVPGLAVARNGSFGGSSSVFFRGTESDHTLVMIDGVQVNQPGGSFDFSGLTTENVERIEIVRGPSSALYGSDALAGVIHVVTRAGRGAPQATVSTQAGSFGRVDGTVEVSGGSDRARYGVTLARYTTDGILDFNNAHDNTVLNGRVEVGLDDATQVRVSARASDRTFNFPTDGSGNLVDRNQGTFNTEALVGVEVDRRLGSSLDVRALVTVFDAENGTDDAPDGPADTLGFYGFQSLNALTRTNADLRANWAAGAKTTLTLGAEFEEQRVRSFNESLSQFGPSTGRSENRRRNRAGYAHVVTGIGSLDANAGVRVEDNEQFGGFTTWQVGASWQATATTRVRTSAGRGIKEPTFFEAFATGFVIGNPELEPERSSTWEVGVEQRLIGERVRLQATWFDQSLTDLIQYTGAPPSPGDPNYFNIAEAASRGLELGATVALAEGLSLTGQYTLLDTEVIDSGFDQGSGANFVEGEALLRRPENQFRLAADWRGQGPLSANVSLLQVGERGDRDFASFPAAPVTLPSYTLLDASVEARLVDPAPGRPGFTLVLRGENLLDEEYQEVFGFRAPGRGLYVGGRVRIGG
jgi:vitamin B12 transporter